MYCKKWYLSVKPFMLFFIQTFSAYIVFVGVISHASFSDLFGPIAGATNHISNELLFANFK